MQLVTKDYQGHAVTFNGEGWINATTEAAKHGKRVDHWLANQETKEYLEALCSMTDTRKSGYVKTSKATLANGGGTWLHPKLAVAFARWLDPKFAVWCDVQIDALIRGKDDWRKLRHAAASSFKMMQNVLQMIRQEDGKETKNYHFINEALMVNFVASGKREPIDRSTLDASSLDLLAHLEEKNAILIGRSIDYKQRKVSLQQCARGFTAKLLGGVAA